MRSNNGLYRNNNITYLKRSSTRYVWSKGMEGDNDSYLCKKDLNCLEYQLYSALNDGSPIDTNDLLKKAIEIKFSY